MEIDHGFSSGAVVDRGVAWLRTARGATADPIRQKRISFIYLTKW